jgi:predicted P-loop ATPase
MAVEMAQPKTPDDYLRQWVDHIGRLDHGGDLIKVQIECEAAAEALLPDIAGGELSARQSAADVARAAERAGLPDAMETVFPLFGLDPPKPVKRKKRAVPAADEFERSEIGQILKNERNVLLALSLAKIAMRYDEFADRYLIDGLEGYGPTLSDHALDELYLLVQREYGFKPSKDDFDRIVLAAARRRRFHPVRDYLDGLSWDGIERIDTWLSHYGGAEDDAFTRAVGRIVLIAAVRRIRQPGCKFDEMLVIEGEQGTLKSSAVAALSPSPQFVSDSLSLSVEERIIIEQTLGKWIVEVGELSGYRKREVEHIKAFLSRQTDSARLAYGRMRMDRPRQFVLIGTTNETNYLIDDTGDRRFWPVRIKAFDITQLLADRDQIWAEAAHWEAEGESIRLPQELWPDAAERQRERKEEDEWTSILAHWLDAEERDPRSLFSHDFQGLRITLADAAKGALGIERGKLESPVQKRIARCLKMAGWQRAERSNGQNYWRRAAPQQ